jgi:hypothetical protein
MTRGKIQVETSQNRPIFFHCLAAIRLVDSAKAAVSRALFPIVVKLPKSS